MITEQCVLITDALGIYVPQEFAKQFNMRDWHVKEQDEGILLSGPNHQDYWETWDDVLNYANIVIDGKTWKLAQDGDLFAIGE